MPGRSGFDFNGSSQSFNVLASYLFGKVIYMFPLCDVPGILLRVSLCNDLLKLKWSLWWYASFQNTRSEQMEMTTPVFTRKGEMDGEKMDMTTPVITKKARSIHFLMSHILLGCLYFLD
jgi:hypothetical protein